MFTTKFPGQSTTEVAIALLTSAPPGKKTEMMGNPRGDVGKGKKVMS